jgi:hypothetical protein
MSNRYFGGNLTNYGEAPTTVEYLVVAGGAGGQAAVGPYYPGTGAGAGGLLQGVNYPVVLGTAITVTIGGGGTGGIYPNSGTNGGNSVFGNITSVGGGSATGARGGSGGGNGTNGGTPGQGNDGGGAGYNNAGGGGAGSAGAGNANQHGLGFGGAGLVSSITGSAIQYAGGGGAGAPAAYAGAAAVAPGGGGGGGSGGLANTIRPTTGLANTGGGGGGGSADGTNVQNGAVGGSGIVVIRYPASFAAARLTTGSPLIYKTGFYRVYVFNASGTITF